MQQMTSGLQGGSTLNGLSGPTDDAAGELAAALTNPYLKQFGLQLEPVPGKGDCMFLAALHSLADVDPTASA